MCSDAVPPPVACEIDSDCPENYFKGGCCMMVDPGALSADLLKASGLVTTKSKMCGEASFKLALEEYKKAGLENTFPIPNTDKKFSA